MKAETGFALDSAGWPILEVEAQGGIRRANAAAVNAFGGALQTPSPTLAGLWSPECATPAHSFLEQIARMPASLPLILLRNKDGATIPYHVASAPVSGPDGQHFLLQLLPAAADVSAGKAGSSESNLAHKQKLDCALQLARTVALDFNNALTSILGHTSLMLSRMEPGHPWRTSLMEVEKSASKAAEIANDLGTFSRQEKEARAQTAGNLNHLVHRTTEFFQQNAGNDPPQWSLQLERKLFAARFDEAKMQQALMKILENSLQAMKGGGRVIIQTRNLELTAPTQDRNVQLNAGSYVCAEISDTGCGIEPEILPRVFEPFFTTKHGGTHRGLGLAWVYGIVTNHGGGVAISSQPGKGTSVRVYLPAENRLAKGAELATDDLSGTQTILMVDDEELLLTMGQTILSAYGYQVVTADSGKKALDLLAKAKSPVDLVITDLVMPAMSGRELVEQVRKVSPTTRIICSSGYVWPSAQENNDAYLQKPFTSQELLVKVKRVLSQEPAAVAE